MLENIKSSESYEYVEQKSKPIRGFIKKLLNDWSFDLSSMIAYNILISILPLAIVLFGIIGFILSNDQEAQQDLKNRIIQSFPSDNATQTGIKQIVNLAFDQLSRDAGGIFAIGILFSLISSSRLFVSIDKSMTIIYRLPERTFIRQTIMSILTLILFVFVFLILLSISSIPTVVLNLIDNNGKRFAVFFCGILVSLFVGFILFEFIYLIIPNKQMKLKQTWCGALIAAFILEIFIILFPLYVRYFMGNYAGQIGFAIILILFFYYFSIILIVGAQINCFFFEHYQPFDQSIGTFIHQQNQTSSSPSSSSSFIDKLCLCHRNQSRVDTCDLNLNENK